MGHMELYLNGLKSFIITFTFTTFIRVTPDGLFYKKCFQLSKNVRLKVMSSFTVQMILILVAHAKQHYSHHIYFYLNDFSNDVYQNYCFSGQQVNTKKEIWRWFVVFCASCPLKSISNYLELYFPLVRPLSNIINRVCKIRGLSLLLVLRYN